MILKNGKRIDGCSDTVPIGTVNPFLGTVAPFGYLLLQGQRESKTTYPELYAICGTTFGPETSTEFTLPDLRGQTIAGYKEGDSIFGTLGGLIGDLTKSYKPEGTNTGTAVTLNAVELTHSGGAVQSHTLTVDEIPSHNHKNNKRLWANISGTQSLYTNASSSGYWFNSVDQGVNDSYTDGTGGGQGHSHGFTQPSKHSFTPTTKTVTNPAFTGTSKDINVVQPTITLNWIVKAFNLLPNSSTVVNIQSESTSNVYSASFVNDLLEQLKRENFDFAHPVGSYYETSDSSWTPQAAGWYGTWVADNDGSALVSYKSSGAFNKATGTIVGGESQAYTPAGKNTGGAVGNHTLTAAESGLPKHKHTVRWDGDNVGAGSAFWYIHREGGGNACDTSETGGTNASSGHNHPFTQPTFTGTQATLSTIQTSKVVYRWHRTA